MEDNVMNFYSVDVAFSNGKHESFEISAKDTKQARSFGLNTARTMMQNRGMRCTIKSIDVTAMYYD